MQTKQARCAKRGSFCAFALSLGLGCGTGPQPTGQSGPTPLEAFAPRSAAPSSAGHASSAPARAAAAAGAGAPLGSAQPSHAGMSMMAESSAADAGTESDAASAAVSGELAAGDYTATICPGRTPMPISADRVPCDGEIRCGGAASCLAATSASSEDRSMAPDCSAGKCVPDAIAMAGKVRFKPCDGSAGPGVCVALCFALVKNPLSSAFPSGEAGCGSEEICAPCLDPLDRTETGACDDHCVE